MKSTLRLLLFIIQSLGLQSASLNPIFTSEMVLQRNTKVRVYGEGGDGEQVTIVFKGQTKSAKVENGAWEVFLDPMQADCTGSEMVFSSRDGTVRLNGILVGDVWVLGGQSNMYRGLSSYPLLKDRMENMNEPMIRIFFVDPNIPRTDQRTTRFKTRFGMGWTAAVYGVNEKTQDFLKGLSPAGYFFACNLAKGKQVAVGIIMACLGATAAQNWTPREVLQEDLALHQYLEADKAIAPNTNRPHMAYTSWLYNGVVYPVTRFAIKGVLWYQGESNAKQAENYRILFPAMIKAWRRDWGQGDFPFVFAQLASYDGSSWAIVRESQCAALALPNTGMITLVDAGDAGDIHPSDKETAGYRFYMKARQVAYGEDIVASGPVFSHVQQAGDSMRITFGNVGEGLAVRQVSMPGKRAPTAETEDDSITRLYSSSDRLAGFTICGADRRFVPAEAEIVSVDSILVRSSDVPNPVAVRYAWANFCLANLYSEAGLPAEPFRTDRFELPSSDAFSSEKGH
jgi:sialate O-acetylesterase